MFKFRVGLGVMVMAVSGIASAASYTVDPSHTYPHFAVNHLGFSTLHGRFNTSTGKMTLDMGSKTGSLELTIDAATLDTAHAKRDEHLRSADFFNTKAFPTITFKSTAVNFASDKVTGVSGDLTIVGVTKPVTFAVQRMACGVNPFSKKETCGFDASASIKRSDFGMKYGIPAIGDEIVLYLGLEAIKE
jgi:polyisoprenoid-binding protein YceI